MDLPSFNLAVRNITWKEKLNPHLLSEEFHTILKVGGLAVTCLWLFNTSKHCNCKHEGANPSKKFSTIIFLGTDMVF